MMVLDLPEDSPLLYIGRQFGRNYDEEEVLLPRERRLIEIGEEYNPYLEMIRAVDEEVADLWEEFAKKYRVEHKYRGGSV